MPGYRRTRMSVNSPQPRRSAARISALLGQRCPECRRFEVSYRCSTPDDFEGLVDLFRIEPYHPDHKFLGLEVRIGADRYVRKRLLKLAHQWIEAGLDGKREAQLPHRRRRPGRQELGLDLLAEDALHF